MFANAYSNGNIDVMNALIKGGILPTAETCHDFPKSNHVDAELFLELVVSSATLELQLEKFRQLPANENNHSMLQELNTLLIQIKNFSSEWTNATRPSDQALQTLTIALDTALHSNLAQHRGFVRTTPVIREITMAIQVILKALLFVCIKIYRCLTLDKNPVHQEGIKEILQQPDTTTVLKIKEFKKTLNKLKRPASSMNQQEEIPSDHSKNNAG